MDFLLIGLAAVVGLAIGLLIGRSMAAQSARRAALLEGERNDALEHAAKIQRAADERKSAVQAAKQAEARVATALAEAEAASAARDEIQIALSALEGRHAKAIEDYRSEIAERERSLASLSERVKAYDRAAERAAEKTAPAVADRANAGEAAVAPEPDRRAIDALERELKQTKQELVTITREREESRTASKRLQTRIRELNRAQERLNASFADRNRRIAELEARLDGKGDAQDSSAPPIAAPIFRPLDVSALDELGANEVLVRAYRHDIAAKDREIKALSELVTRRERTINRLKKSASPALPDQAAIDAANGAPNGLPNSAADHSAPDRPIE